MALQERRHLGRQEESIEETGIQVRNDDPISPVEGQVWINKAQNRLKIFNQNSVVILVDGSIGAAMEVPAEGEMDLAKSRSYFKNVTAPYTITNIKNFSEGVLGYLKLRNSNPNIKEVVDLTIPAPTTIANGSYFLLNSASDMDKFYVWADFDNTAVDPAVGGRTGIKVNTSIGLVERTSLTMSSASDMTSGQYFFINSANNARKFFVWFNKDGAGGMPTTITDREAIQVNITASDSASTVASKLIAALISYTEFSGTSTGNVVTVSTTAVGPVDNIENATVSNMLINVLQQGKAPETATQFAIKVAQALVATGKFEVPEPTTPTIRVTNVDFGFTQNPEGGTMLPVITIITEGSGRVAYAFPASCTLDENLNGYIDGQTEILFGFFKSGATILVTNKGKYTL